MVWSLQIVAIWLSGKPRRDIFLKSPLFNNSTAHSCVMKLPYCCLDFLSGKMVFSTCKVILPTLNQHTLLGNFWAPPKVSITKVHLVMAWRLSLGHMLQDHPNTASLPVADVQRLAPNNPFPYWPIRSLLGWIHMWFGKDWGLHSCVYGQRKGRERNWQGVMSFQWPYLLMYWRDVTQWPMLCVSWRTGLWVEDNGESLTTHGAGSVAGTRNHRAPGHPLDSYLCVLDRY